ncbi:low-density lipoprotein receptor-related protein 12-like [Asterias rubens]|uniref:low-density lipoprotein receptor-related protein 12-like n=1 Tax=Asterias rubens TaxID=7604 RepID=UPI001455967A|nr:low-density lipoprotein receptor-related protein 12-like [Asterias rubens]
MSISAEIQRVMLAVSLVLLLGGFGNAISGFDNFVDRCGETVDIENSGDQVDSQMGVYYENDLDCTVTLTTSFGRQILLEVTSMIIKGDPSDCRTTDYLEVFDGPAKVTSVGLFCGNDASIYDSITSTANSITVQFKTNVTVTGTGFYFVYTSFSMGPCTEDEFKCNNGHCIDKSLTDNLLDNCGDFSDFGGGEIFDTAMNLFKLGIGVLIAIIVGVIVAVVLCCVCVGCLCYHCCCKNRQQQTQYQQAPMAMQQQPTQI